MAHPQRRFGWTLAHLDVDAVELLDSETLRHELEATKSIAAPLNAFIDAAEKRLNGDPTWRSAHDSHIHRHANDVVFANGVTVNARSFVASDPYARKQPADFGMYFDRAWSPPWPHEHIDWPDFGVPANSPLFVASCRALLARARDGEAVEIGCLGGHGRTGTALAVLALLADPTLDRNSAVEWVRSNYCDRAVETEAQATFVHTLNILPVSVASASALLLLLDEVETEMKALGLWAASAEYDLPHMSAVNFMQFHLFDRRRALLWSGTLPTMESDNTALTADMSYELKDRTDSSKLIRLLSEFDTQVSTQHGEM